MARRLARTLLPSLPDLIFICTIFLILWLGQFISNRDGDLGFHIAIGRLILDTMSIPTQDVFSYTMLGHPFVPQEWLSEIIFAATYMAGGFDAVALLTATVIGATFGGIAAVMLRRGVSPLVVLPLVALGVLVSIGHLATRPHVFTLLITFVWATALEEHRRGNLSASLFWCLPLLMLVWVNLHGAFVFGDILAATYLFGAVVMWLVSGGADRARHFRQARDLVLLLAICIALSGLNPRGFGLMSNNAGFFQQAVQFQMTPEWQSPDFHNLLFYPLLLLITLAMMVSVRRELTPVLLLASWTAFTLYSFRNLDQLVAICLPLLGESLHKTLAEGVASVQANASPTSPLHRSIDWLRRQSAQLREAHSQTVGGVASLLAVVAIAGLLSSGMRIDLAGRGYGFSEREFPIVAVEQIKPFPPGQRVFNDAQWGGYLNFCCWPQVRNFFDGRIDFYEIDHILDYYRVQEAEPGWEEVLERHQVDWVMVFPDRPLVRWLEQDPAWQRIYGDTTAVVFVRRSAAGASSAP
jgi:hypothetical protein